ncbi:hypothetical protein KP509_14G094800 [Ceratopteris richardii]|uniref:Uncharacterized protein n=1 Tax=Ceratopteris richardii TaxID=49495 RepID=A0A8T2TED5_CERRI|nr:hypothetical protein KP509_14G094800 [Ceratopteris richardii]
MILSRPFVSSYNHLIVSFPCQITRSSWFIFFFFLMQLPDLNSIAFSALTAKESFDGWSMEAQLHLFRSYALCPIACPAVLHPYYHLADLLCMVRFPVRGSHNSGA